MRVRIHAGQSIEHWYADIKPFSIICCDQVTCSKHGISSCNCHQLCFFQRCIWKKIEKKVISSTIPPKVIKKLLYV